jgi:hypothetical protein
MADQPFQVTKLIAAPPVGELGNPNEALGLKRQPLKFWKVMWKYAEGSVLDGPPSH